MNTAFIWNECFFCRTFREKRCFYSVSSLSGAPRASCWTTTFLSDGRINGDTRFLHDKRNCALGERRWGRVGVGDKRAACSFKEISVTNQFISVIKKGISFADEQNAPPQLNWVTICKMDFLFPGPFCWFQPIKSQFVFSPAIKVTEPPLVPPVPPLVCSIS